MEEVDWINGDPELLRRVRASSPEVVSPTLPDDVTITELAPLGGCPGGLIFTPSGPLASEPAPAVVYFHGGGFIVGSPHTHRIVTAWIAHLTRVPVISIDYRLAPEHQLPAQREDAVAAIRRQLAVYPRLRVMGDSAGAMLSLWAHSGLTEAERGRIEDLVLFYPGGMPHGPAPTTQDESTGLGPLSLASYRRRLDPKGIAQSDPAYDPTAPDFPLPKRMTLVGATEDPVCNQSELMAQLPGARLVLGHGLGHSFLGALPAEESAGPLRQALGIDP